MTPKKPIRLGIMGFGQTGRQLYELAACSDDIEVVAIADIGKPEILHYLLCSEVKNAHDYQLQGNFLVNPRFKSRLMPIDSPAEMPWDIFGVDAVVDCTGIYRERTAMEGHLNNGAPRILLRTLPVDHIDRLVIPGVNHAQAEVDDRMISAGSPTFTALSLLLHVVSGHCAIECASMTTVHAYTSDQALQDYAGSDFRRSRSAAKNIIPNTHEASLWLSHVLPQFGGNVLTSALNVPVQEGCLLDVNLVVEDESVGVDAVNDAMRACRGDYKGIIDVVEDPIVSSDIIGNPHSLLFDAKGTIKAGANIIKTLSWYETLGHAARLLDVVRIYADLDAQKEAVS